MGAQLTAVAINSCHMVCALQLDILPLALGGVGQVDDVSADAAPIVGTAVLAVQSVPGVGQCYGSKSLAVLGKPGGSQKCFDTHKLTPFKLGMKSCIITFLRRKRGNTSPHFPIVYYFNKCLLFLQANIWRNYYKNTAQLLYKKPHPSKLEAMRLCKCVYQTRGIMRYFTFLR